MLLGRYQHTLDAKGRVFVPAKLRETLGERFVATKGKDVCICIYPMEEWSRQEAKLLALPSKYSDLQRFYFSNAAELEPDKQGRVLLPADLRAVSYTHLMSSPARRSRFCPPVICLRLKAAPTPKSA